MGLPSPELWPRSAPTVAQSPAPSACPPPRGGSLGPHAARAAGCVSSSRAPSGRRRTAPGPWPGHQPWTGNVGGPKFHIRGRLPVGAAKAAAARGLRAPQLTSGRAPKADGAREQHTSSSDGCGDSGSRPARRRRASLAWPGAEVRGTREASAAAPRVARTGPGERGKPAVPGPRRGRPRLAGSVRARAAGRRRADSGALRARWGSHSDEIPVPGQRHQPASAFLLLHK
ncbi:translation initiation factor IF-2-like [Marmota marmota marmota]|uniref:translation initiation factor IF-2-like n=1 Tax=Marmota marmota marmota TaxID=9994 RepID=UPI0007623E03|nr:translation initiation factor IF-2-like [Marmota marmota marmota]